MELSSALTAWAAAMDRQTAHEAVCSPCRLNRTPVCPEGVHLQRAAWAAGNAWAADKYGGKERRSVA